jgi:hypothetical protein
MKATINLCQLVESLSGQHILIVPTEGGGFDQLIDAGTIPAAVEVEIDVHEALALGGQIAAIWSVEDVQQERPNLTEDQAWEVLQRVEHYHDCNYGITWDTLRLTADALFPRKPRQRPKPAK